MYELEIKRHFSAAHQLRGYDGKCRDLHGHNYQVAVLVRASGLDRLGLAVDFTELKAALDELLGSLDHKFLNELAPFREDNPTSENIARHLYLKLSEKINRENIRVWKVRVWESDTSSVTYFEE